LITAANIDLIIKKNRQIKDEVTAQTIKLQTNHNIMQAASRPQFALLINADYPIVHYIYFEKFSGCLK